MRIPSLATQLQKELGVGDASACDVSAGCAGFVYAVEDAWHKMLIENASSTDARREALVVGVDGLSHITDWTDRGTCVLLGDGAGAVVLGEVHAGGILATHTERRRPVRPPPLLRAPRRADPRGSLPGCAVRASTWAELASSSAWTAPKCSSPPCETMVARRPARPREVPPSPPVETIERRATSTTSIRTRPTCASSRWSRRRLGVPPERVYTGRHRPLRQHLRRLDPARLRGHAGTSSGRATGPWFEIDVAFGAGFASGAILREV